MPEVKELYFDSIESAISACNCSRQAIFQHAIERGLPIYLLLGEPPYDEFSLSEEAGDETGELRRARVGGRDCPTPLVQGWSAIDKEQMGLPGMGSERKSLPEPEEKDENQAMLEILKSYRICRIDVGTLSRWRKDEALPAPPIYLYVQYADESESSSNQGMESKLRLTTKDLPKANWGMRYSVAPDRRFPAKDVLLEFVKKQSEIPKEDESALKAMQDKYFPPYLLEEMELRIIPDDLHACGLLPDLGSYVADDDLDDPRWIQSELSKAYTAWRHAKMAGLTADQDPKDKMRSFLQSAHKNPELSAAALDRIISVASWYHKPGPKAK